MPAARIGPTVWELDGPMPIENRSKTDTAIGKLLIRTNGQASGRADRRANAGTAPPSLCHRA
ncbi:hypothetical protein Aab01nite_05210 [Paractinoplanes abujensis]|nr:hypothetical protein Aab01nite_05210 [Actinoplanes abujensis]